MTVRALRAIALPAAALIVLYCALPIVKARYAAITPLSLEPNHTSKARPAEAHQPAAFPSVALHAWLHS